MIRVRKSDQRGHADHGWLKTFHTFSFNTYQDPAHSPFRSLRVMNEDWVAPGKGFGTHPHADMEIATYVLAGALEHKDSMGNGEVLRPGEFQRVSAGTGITHSEFNPSKTEPVHLYQIWLLPQAKGIKPSYEQKSFDDGGLDNKLRLVASPDGSDGSLTIHQDARIFLSRMAPSTKLVHSFDEGRHAWIQVLRGSMTLGKVQLDTSDEPAAISDEQAVEIIAQTSSEIMLFDLN